MFARVVHGVAEAGTAEGEEGGEAGGAGEKKEFKPKRTTKGQDGRLWVLAPDRTAERYQVPRRRTYDMAAAAS